MVLGLLAIGMGAAYLSSVPASSAQQLVSTATVEAKTIAEFLMSRIAGHVEKGGALRALGNDASSQRRSRLLLAIGGVSAIFVAQKLYNRFIKARSIQGSTVLVTGASQGIGAAVSAALVAKGAKRVFMVARSEDKLQRVCDSINNTRHKADKPATCFAVDASSPEQVRRFADELPCTPDIVVNCAGAGTWRFLSESTVDELRGNFAAPFMAAMWTSRAVLPAMVARRSGLILNVQSPAAYGPWGGATGYVAGRWALRGLSQALQADLQGTGVYVQEVVLPLTQSAYFKNNPGSRERVPGIALLLGTHSVSSAAQGVIDAIESGEDVYTHSWRLYLTMAVNDWFPAVTAALVRFTGWTLANHGNLEMSRP